MSLNPKAIIQGWKNYIFTDKEQEQRAKKRAEFCRKCPHSQIGTIATLLPDQRLEQVQGLICSKCGCPLSTLLRQEVTKCNHLKNLKL